MKSLKIKIGLMFALVVSIFAACSDDNDSNPVLPSTAPSTFTLNTPALASQSIEINADSKLALSWAVPDYGFPLEVTYKVQPGLPQSDGSIKWYTDSLGNNMFIGDAITGSTSVDVDGQDLAEALCDMDGITRVEDYVDMGSRPVAFRIYADILDAQQGEQANTGVFSNPVTFAGIQSYQAVIVPGYIYLIGQPSGWQAPNPANAEVLENWKLNETGRRTGIFKGTFHINAGEFSLRFYKDLNDGNGGWGDNGTSHGIGSHPNDGDNETITLDESGTYSGSSVDGKGNWIIDNFPGGDVNFTVDTKNNTVTFELAQ